MDRLAGITAFVRVAESGGFSAAARNLNLSTTTISDQVQALENALGVRLFNRTTRRVNLTEVGREYYDRCSQILQELAEADEAAGALQVTPRGRLRVYCHQGLVRFIASVATRLLQDYPEVSLDLLTGDAMIDLVQEGFDLAVMPTSPPDSMLSGARWQSGTMFSAAPHPISRPILHPKARPTSPTTTLSSTPIRCSATSSRSSTRPATPSPPMCRAISRRPASP